MRKIFFTLSFLVLFSLSFSQDLIRAKQNVNFEQSDELQKLELSEACSGNSTENSENQSPFEAVKGKKEDLSKRDAFSKHYINEDGSYTALIGAGPIHYDNNGNWEDINHRIVETNDSDYKYANTTNVFESYFGTYLQNGIISKTQEAKLIEFLNPKMYWEVNGEATQIQTAENVQVSIEEDKAIYKNIFGEISAEYTILTAKRELNYIIPSLEALGNIVSQAEYLVFVEEIELAENLTATMQEQGIIIKDQYGESIYLYEKPHSTDAETMALRVENTIFEMQQNGNILTIKTKVKTSWLLDVERVFPVRVDPTVSVYPDNTTNWTRSVSGTGNNYTNLLFGVVGINSLIWAVTSMKFNTASIQSGSILNSVVGYFYLTEAYKAWGGTVRYSYSADPTAYSGLNLYNSINGELSNSLSMQSPNSSWKNITLNSTGLNHVQSNINGTVNLGLDPVAGYNYYGQYYAAVNHTNNNRPYLSITYTVPSGPPSCASLIGPGNGATGIAHQGVVAWNTVVGATNYDVYFGTSSNPPLVSSNQTGTTYDVGDCLLPNTKYYWKVIAKNANGSATGCPTWSFTTDGKLHIYRNNFNEANPGVVGTSGVSVDGWYANNNSATGGAWNNGYNNAWTVGDGPNAIDGYSIGVSALYNGGLGGNFFQYWSDLGEIHRWVYRPFNFTGLRDIELSFRWKCGGESGQDYGTVASSINGGANWLTDDQGGLNNDGKYWNSSSTIRTQTLVFPESRNNLNNVLLAFKWDDLSGNGYSNDPSFVVDDIVVKACPYEGVITSNKVASGIYEWTPPTSNTQTILTVNGSHQCAQYQWEQSINNGATWTSISGATSYTYTTPSNITAETWFRAKVYFGNGCTGVYQDEVFKIKFVIPLVCNELSNLAVQLGNPFNGTNHYIDVSWDALQAATGYDIQYSDDNSTWQDASPSSVTTTSASLNMGDNPNKKYWFRVRAKNNTTTCEWNSIGPIYTACDEPELPYLSNAVGTSLDLEIQAETPVANPNITEYAIYCETTSQYVQANGYLGASPVWQTKANWGTVNVKGLTANEEYCFYVLARNGDGHIVGEQEGGGNIIISETFDTNSNFSNSSSSGPTDKWWSPGTTTSGNTMSHSSSGSECGTNGFVGYGGNWNNYHGSFLRSPEINCNGFDAITMTFDFTNTGTNRENDYLSFNMWADGGYVNALSVNGNAGNKLQFDIARTCENIKVEFDISGIANKSNIMFYINANCGYNDSPMYSYQIKNVILAESVSSSENSACITLGLASTPIFHDFGGEEQLSFNYSKYNNDKPIFRLSHPGSSATKYEIEVNTKFDFTGSSWTQTYTGTYSENTENNFAFTQTSGNLTSGSTYYVRARIDQGSGWGMWTNELYSFTYDTNITIPEWFKTTTPQFSTDALVGTINQSDELKPEVSGGGGNIIVNGNFANTSGWTTYKTSGTGAVIEVSSSDCVNCPPGTTRNLKISLYVASVVGGDKLIVSQQVDLTGVDQITYNANSYYAPNSNGFSGKISDLKFIIGGSYNDESGTVMHSTDQAYCSGSYCSNTLNDNNVVINTTSFSGVQTIKFVVKFTSDGSIQGLFAFYVNNVASASITPSIITTTPSYISSIQNAIGYDKIIWNQTLGAKAPGDIKITIQGSSDGVNFSNVTGFVDMLAPDGNGAKNIDISTIDHTIYPYLRAIFYLNNQNARLHDFGFSYKNKPLPVSLLSFTAKCEDDKINFAWSTASEMSSEYFEIIETKNFIHFNTLAKISAAGFSSQTINYEYQAKANYEKTYYQLKQYDFDGKNELLSTIVSDCKNNIDNEIYVYPNPNNGEEVIISTSSVMDEAFIFIYDAAGRLIREFKFLEFGGENVLKFKPKLEPGAYVIKIINSNNEYKYFKIIVN